MVGIIHTTPAKTSNNSELVVLFQVKLVNEEHHPRGVQFVLPFELKAVFEM